MKKEVEICDNCKNGIALAKCHICNMDVCKNCSQLVYFEQVNIYEYFMALRKIAVRSDSVNQNEFLIICKECEQKINKDVRVFFNMKNEGRKILITEIFDLLVKRLPEIVLAEKI